MSRDIVGVVLAGGKSLRMGSDKAQMLYGNKTFVGYMEDVLREAGLEDVLISNEQNIADVIVECGPLGGVHALVKKFMHKYSDFVFVPVDMLGLTASLLEGLLCTEDGNRLVRYDGQVMPFRLKGDEKLVQEIENVLMAGDDVSLKGFFGHLPTTLLDVSDDMLSCFVNVNTPQQLNDLLSERLV